MPDAGSSPTITTATEGTRPPAAAYAASSPPTRSNIAAATERPSRILARPSTAAIPPAAVTVAPSLVSRGLGATEPALAHLLTRAGGRLLDLTQPLVRLGKHSVREAT